MSKGEIEKANEIVEAQNTAAMTKPAYKIKFTVKLVAFVAATISLSWFFEGWRQINDSPTVQHFSVICAGTVATIFILTMMAYWTYFEEKAKGTLKKRVDLFEYVYDRLHRKANQHLIMQGERIDHGQ